MYTILVTGGSGYIGSHAVIELLNKGHEVIILDNLSNSSINVVSQLRDLSKKEIVFENCDLRDENALEQVFSSHKVDLVIHFAGLKSVAESVQKPITYFENNVVGTVNLLKMMNKFSIKKIIFSSSATVYGNCKEQPLIESQNTQKPSNPYGLSKLIIEEMIKDVAASDKSWSAVILRYFNPIGAHSSGEIGESPKGIPNNLMPYLLEVAIGKKDKLLVYGDNYNTIDGTGVRDYIHVMDLVKGHIRAIDRLSRSGIEIYNLGTGKGYSVLELIESFQKINNVEIPYEVVGRRDGDIDICFADPSKAKSELNWTAEMSIEEMCRDVWNFKRKFPKGL